VKKYFRTIAITGITSLIALSACATTEARQNETTDATALYTPNITNESTMISNYEPLSQESESGKLTITLDFTRQTGWASNQFAVWIEDMDGNYIQTLYATRWTADGGFRSRDMSIPTWVERSNLANMEQSEVDIISSPTPQTGTLSYTWDLTDNEGNAVLSGEYRFFVEGSLRWGNRVVYSGIVDISGSSATIMPEAEFIFESVDGHAALTADSPENNMITAVTAHFVAGNAIQMASADDLYRREQLMEMGFSETELDMLIEAGISLENMLNQMRFGGYVDDVFSNRPIGASGNVIEPRYSGGIYFNDAGVLTVTVLEAAFEDYASAIAIEEMRELGIIVRSVEFTEQELIATMDALFEIFESIREVGVSSWGLDTIANRVTVWIDPYTDEQNAMFMDLVIESSINSSMIAIQSAVTPEMRERRADSIAYATQSPGNQIVLVGEVEVSRTGIAFSLENRTEMEFTYGAPWDLAHYVDGDWLPMPHLPGAGSGMWTMQAYTLQGGGIQQYRQNWEWFFGELPPGRYMFIRDGWLGDWDAYQGRVYALVEFVITADSPEYLPPQPDIEWPTFIELVGYSGVTPNGMSIVVENTSAYDIDHMAQILAIVPERYAVSDYWWDWQWYGLPFLPVDGYWIDYLMQGEGFLPSGGQLEFSLDWTTIFGELSPGEYKIILSLGGRAHPPHPTGWAFGETLVISFTI